MRNIHSVNKFSTCKYQSFEKNDDVCPYCFLDEKIQSKLERPVGEFERLSIRRIRKLVESVNFEKGKLPDLEKIVDFPSNLAEPYRLMVFLNSAVGCLNNDLYFLIKNIKNHIQAVELPSQIDERERFIVKKSYVLFFSNLLREHIEKLSTTDININFNN